MQKCNNCSICKPTEEMVLVRGVVSTRCKSCKNAGKRERRQQKKDGVFVDKNSPEYRAKKFIEIGHAIHNGVYSYERVKYSGAHEKVEIFCTKHQGYFWQVPTSHTSGNGCFDCGIKQTASKRKYTKEEYIALAKEVWGDEFDYAGMEYVDCFTPIKIKCKIHGVVEVVPTQHLSGRGCKKCAKNGYSVDKPGHLYVLTMGNLTKVGITNMTPEDRAKVLSRNHQDNFEVVHSAYWEDGDIANEIETLLLRYLSSKYDNPEERFHGWTETFLHVDKQDLLNKMKEIQHDRYRPEHRPWKIATTLR